MSAIENDDGWQRRPSEQDADREFKIIRAPSKGTIEVLVLSHDLIGRLTHFYDGRTRPCTGEACVGCGRGIRREWHGYLAGIQERLNRKVILEVTSGPGRRLGEAFDRHRTLRGISIELSRKGNRPNGEVFIRCSHTLANDVRLPAVPDLRPILLRMWQVNTIVVDAPRKIIRPRLADTGTDGPSRRKDDGEETEQTLD